MRVLVLAVSARMLAQLAAADGHEVIAFDRFGDVDLRAVAPGATAARTEALAALTADAEADAVVYGAGFENRPDLVRRIAAGRELLGTSPERLAAARDPWAVAAAARKAGARAPESRRAGGEGARPGDGWLRKPQRGGGGRGVRRWAGGVLRASEILQRRIDGLSCSAVAIGNGRTAMLLGITEQLHRPPGFAWTGNVTPPRLPASEHDELAGQLGAVSVQMAARFGVRGAFGVDAVWDGRSAWVLEVNPRPPASLELFDTGTFAAHVTGARGLAVPAGWAQSGDSEPRVKLVLFADRDLRAPDPAWWPPGMVRDIPHDGEAIRRGAPVCTLVCTGTGVEEVSALGARLLAQLPGGVPAHA